MPRTATLCEKIFYRVSRPLVLSYTGAVLKMDVQRFDLLPPGPAIIAANHPSTTDPFYVAGMLRRQSFILIKDLLFQVPVLGEYLRRSGHIPVEAGRGEEALATAAERLRAGHTVIIFPEGVLSPAEGGCGQARTGVARLALMSGAPVVPVGIHLQMDRAHVYESNVKGQVEMSRWYFRGPYHLTVGRPIRFSGEIGDRPRVREIADTVMGRIMDLARESERRMNDRSPMHGLMPRATA